MIRTVADISCVSVINCYEHQSMLDLKISLSRSFMYGRCKIINMDSVISIMSC